MRRSALLMAGVVLLASCQNSATDSVKQEVLSFILNDSTRANIPLDAQGEAWTIRNGGEVIQLPQVTSAHYHVPVFNGSIVMRSESEGVWIDSLRPANENGSYQVQLERRHEAIIASEPVSGTWDVWFGESSHIQEGDARAQLDLQVAGTEINGTMRTPTGDYRFLSGSFDGKTLKLQTFDGAHLFRFDATAENGMWTNGNFYSGNHYHVGWSGRPAEPWPTTDAVEKIHPDLDSLIVRCIDRNGNPVTQSLLPATGQVKVVDILGTWCPNCMDEVRLLTSMNGDHLDRLSVAFERPKEAETAYERIDAFAAEMNVDWDVQLGGSASKTEAAAAFPFLNEVISFPTTLFIQHNGTVHIHSGFNGPATGEHYVSEKAAFKRYSTPLTSLENH